MGHVFLLWCGAAGGPTAGTAGRANRPRAGRSRGRRRTGTWRWEGAAGGGTAPGPPFTERGVRTLQRPWQPRSTRTNPSDQNRWEKKADEGQGKRPARRRAGRPGPRDGLPTAVNMPLTWQ
ncbi:hypothetical protein SLNWT_3106 [Streptomyces albus]|uniref:Uncharacterized protein n=1 Tax=Streptomyces albus (strain ATCC 21838 / DSM 41398 / FERM P-419 / JCM 4703 / NBRC 107858) TaxID=1081613 RepID=A0A0B5EZJ9_STRA4|nr:hypothetical protein SLNWT_3106 [Streptomyces albus]AOU77791.1 hypothetical protein SLNHY_3100 [Streptomyces albus]AYN33552.1 hypothetical protein DUI70_3051 [Streptomyces albus]